MLETVDIARRGLDTYRGIAPESTLDELTRRAGRLRGARVLHVNATPYGGGVSELLRSTVPILNALGIVADWKIIGGDEAFFQATKGLHNALQGARGAFTDVHRTKFLEQSRVNAALAAEEYDFVFVHDPQPAALPTFRGKGSARWIWRCHIDTSEPDASAWSFLQPHLGYFDAAIFTMASFVPKDFPVARIEVFPPAIDPLSPKNMELPDRLAREILRWTGVPTDRPLITQVSRFDPWKDPLGVVRAYRIARAKHPGLTLALVGSMALDDPEGWEVYARIRAEVREDPLVHVLTNLTGIGNIEVNAFQRLSNVVVQKSLREGFGLVVSEALWKGTPVVAGRAGGIPLQMADGVGGSLVDDVESCARAIVALLDDAGRAKELGRAGRERVREHFLTPRLVLNELELMDDLAESREIVRPATWYLEHDPVCGMAVAGYTELVADEAGRRYTFCSEQCRQRFIENPTRYTTTGASSDVQP
jgi:trehalose synthase